MSEVTDILCAVRRGDFPDEVSLPDVSLSDSSLVLLGSWGTAGGGDPERPS